MTITQLFQQVPLRRKNAFTYNVIVPAVNKPVTLAEVKAQLNIPLADTSKDAYLNLLIDAATAFGEKCTKREFINKTFRTFRNTFADCKELRRSHVSVINSIEYLLDGVFTAVTSTVYGFTDVTGFSHVFLEEDQSWPTDVDNVPQAIKIEFVAGYGPDDTDVPADIKLALLNHIAMMYSNRGDCSCDAGNAATLPATTKALYDKIRIMDITSCDNLDKGFLYNG